MKGNIYPAAGQKCPLCGGKFRHQEGHGMFCPKHPAISPNKYEVRFGKKITRRFETYNNAIHFLYELRVRSARPDFDIRDYQVGDKPLSFSHLATEWLEYKKPVVRRGTYDKLVWHLKKARAYFSDTNIKDILPKDIELFLRSLELSSKSKANILGTLKQFWQWCYVNYDVPKLKEWPKQGYTMAYRKTIPAHVQSMVLDEIKRQTKGSRLWLGVYLLANYPSIRPGEMRMLDERHVDRDRGILIVPPEVSKTGKDGKFKMVGILPEDMDIINSYPRSLDPGAPLFRHEGRANHGCNRIQSGDRFGRNAFRRAWNRACEVLGIEGVDLYGGTKHSTAQDLLNYATFEEVKKATMVHSNKAFERYLRFEGKEIEKIYLERRKDQKKVAENVVENPALSPDPNKPPINQKPTKKSAKVLKLFK